MSVPELFVALWNNGGTIILAGAAIGFYVWFMKSL